MVQLHAVSLGNETVSSFLAKALKIYEIVDFIHIRERAWTVQQYVEAITSLRAYDADLAKVVINDRLDVASIYQVPNLHLPSHGHDLQAVKKHAPDLRVGCSVHHVTAAKRQAEADYMFFGHIFQTASKKGLQARGLLQLQKVVQAVSTPVIALGGLTIENIDDVMKVGPAGIAVMSGIFAADDCAEAARQYRQTLQDRKGDKDGSDN